MFKDHPTTSIDTQKYTINHYSQNPTTFISSTQLYHIQAIFDCETIKHSKYKFTIIHKTACMYQVSIQTIYAVHNHHTRKIYFKHLTNSRFTMFLFLFFKYTMPHRSDYAIKSLGKNL